MRRAAMCLAALLTGCGGGGGSVAAPGPVPPAPQPSGGGGSAATAVAHVTIALGGPSSSSRRRRPRYVSPATAAVQITVMPGGTTTTSSLVPGSANCPTSGGTTTCSIAVTAPIGSDNFEITLLDASGNALSHGAIPQAIAANAANTVGITLDGVVATVTLTPAATTVPTGTTSTFSVVVAAKDAQGYTILGPGGFDAAVQLDSDQASAVTISPAVLTSPVTAVAVTFSGAYTGTFSVRAWTNGMQVGSVPLTAAANASPVPTPSPTATPTAAPTGAATPTPTPTPAPTFTPLYVVDGVAHRVDVVDTNGNGAATFVSSPVPVGSHVVAVAHNASDGSIWVADAQQSPAVPSIQHYAASGSPLSGAAQLTTYLHPTAIAIDPRNGNVWVADGTLNALVEYAAGIPIAAIAGSASKLSSPNGVAVDASGYVYATNNSGSDYLVFDPSNASRGPVRDVHLAQTAAPVGIAVDAASVYLLSSNPTPRIDQLPLASTGSNPQVTRTITWKTYTQPTGIAVGPLGNLYVADRSGTVLVFTTAQSGTDVVAARTIGGFGSALAVAR